MGNPTYFVDDVAVAARKAEASQSIPDASWVTGMNAGGSNACGIGINQAGGAVVGTPEQFRQPVNRRCGRTIRRRHQRGYWQWNTNPHRCGNIGITIRRLDSSLRSTAV